MRTWRPTLATTFSTLAAVGLTMVAFPAAAQPKPIRVGYPVILSGPAR